MKRTLFNAQIFKSLKTFNRFSPHRRERKNLMLMTLCFFLLLLFYIMLFVMTWFWDNEVESNEMLKVEFCGVPRHEQSNHFNSSHFRNNDTPTLGVLFKSFFFSLLMFVFVNVVCNFYFFFSTIYRSFSSEWWNKEEKKIF